MQRLFWKGSSKLYLKNGTTKPMVLGEALIEVVGTADAGQAIGSDDVDVLVVYAGAKGMPTTVLTK